MAISGILSARSLRLRIALLLAALTAVWLGALPARAFEPNPGDRAADLSGWDVVHQRTAALGDYRGKWVFVEFWAAW